MGRYVPASLHRPQERQDAYLLAAGTLRSHRDQGPARDGGPIGRIGRRGARARPGPGRVDRGRRAPAGPVRGGDPRGARARRTRGAAPRTRPPLWRRLAGLAPVASRGGGRGGGLRRVGGGAGGGGRGGWAGGGGGGGGGHRPRV